MHTPGEPEIVEPTATEEGTKTIKCSVCGEVLSTEKIPAKGVDSSDAGTTKAPDKNTGKNPVTGDNMVYVIVIAAVAVIGCSAVVVIRKKKASER